MHGTAHLSMELISYVVPSLLVERLDFRLILIYPLCLSLYKNNAQSTVDFLRLTDSNRRFFSAILKILIEDRRDAHAKQFNNNKNIVDLVVGDIVMA